MSDDFHREDRRALRDELPPSLPESATLGIHYHQDADLRVACPFCGSSPGELCSTTEGASPGEVTESLYAHQSRRAAAAVAFTAPECMTPNDADACVRCGGEFTAASPKFRVGEYSAGGHWQQRFVAHRECITILGNRIPPAPEALSRETGPPVDDGFDGLRLIVSDAAYPRAERQALDRLLLEHHAMRQTFALATGEQESVIEELRSRLASLEADRPAECIHGEMLAGLCNECSDRYGYPNRLIKQEDERRAARSESKP
jgi:hypothetical protein